MRMRALWWLLKLAARTATRIRNASQPAAAVADVMGAQLDTEEAPPRAALSDFVDADQSDIYAKTFCGQCGAAPGGTKRRCGACLKLLERVYREVHGDGVERALAELAREGEL